MLEYLFIRLVRDKVVIDIKVHLRDANIHGHKWLKLFGNIIAIKARNGRLLLAIEKI
tara:strand:- start:271 stop:441 length:171 start_codon:yes stop_codon:yes gene_type:complete